MHFIAHIDLAPGHSPQELGPLREAEDDAVRSLVRQGIVTAPFLRTDRPGAIFLMSADTAADAESALAGLPAVKAGIVVVTALTPLTFHAAHPDFRANGKAAVNASIQETILAVKHAILAKNWSAYEELIAEDVKWFTPLFDEPLVGKSQMLRMQQIVFGEVFDAFDYPDIGFGDQYAYMHFAGTVDGVDFSGTDRLIVKDGRVVEFHVDGRTLPAMTHFGQVVGEALARHDLIPN